MNFERITNVFKCRICKNTLNEPVVLPCGVSVCEDHVLNVLERIDEGKSFDCIKCNQEHQVPEKGFPQNSELKELIHLKLDKISFGSQNKLAKNLCKQFENLLEELKILENDPSYFIDDYFKDIMNKIDLEREQLKIVIDKNCDEMIKRLDDDNKKFQEAASLNKKEINDLFEKNRNLLKQWNEELEIPNFNLQNEWKKIGNKCEIEITKIGTYMNDLKNSLLNFNSYEFIPNMKNYQSNIGQLKIQKTTLYENSFDGSIQLKLKRFSDSIKTCGLKFENQNEHSIKNKSWKISARIEQTENFESCLSFFIKFFPSNYDEFVKAEVLLRIIQIYNDAECLVKTEESFQDTFRTSKGKGYPNFILIKDLMDANNGLYDDVRDLIILEARIKYKD